MLVLDIFLHVLIRIFLHLFVDDNLISFLNSQIAPGSAKRNTGNSTKKFANRRTSYDLSYDTCVFSTLFILSLSGSDTDSLLVMTVAHIDRY